MCSKTCIYKEDTKQTYRHENYNEMKITLAKINNIFDIAEENFSEQEDVTIKTIQNYTYKKRILKK